MMTMDGHGTTRLRLCTFKGVQNLPLYVAVRHGFFAARGLEVEVAYTTGSAAQLGGLVRGEYHLAQTAPDNVVNLNDNPTAFGLDRATAPRVTLLCGGSVGPLGLYTQPAITAVEGLRGARLGVDNPTSGFALVLRDMLARHGLAHERDYSVAVTGGTSARLDALRSGTVDGTVLYAPYDALAAEEGYHELASSADYYAAYASLATAALTGWAEARANMVTDYLAALLQALRWIYDPGHANAEATQEIMRDEPALGLDAAMAARAYAAFRDPATGYGVDAALDDAGLETVIALRATYGTPSRPLDPPASYHDLCYYDRARSAR